MVFKHRIQIAPGEKNNPCRELLITLDCGWKKRWQIGKEKRKKERTASAM
jgi:RNase P subunit RPR2